MAVAKNCLYHRPQSALLQYTERCGIARIPGRLQVDEHMDLAALRSVLNSQLFLIADGQRLLDHYVDAQCSALLNHSPVLARSSKDEHCTGMRLRNHFLNAAKVHACGKTIALCI